MKIKEWDEVRSDVDGEAYIIARIVNSMVVLKPKYGGREIITGVDSLRACPFKEL